MAVANDGEADLAGNTAAGTSHAFGNKTTAGSNRIGIVHLQFASAAFATEPATVTWGGSGMTQIGTGVNFGSDPGGVRSYYIVDPPTGSTAVAATTTATTELGYVVCSFNGADTTGTPIDTGSIQTATGTSTTPSVTVSSAAGNMVVSVAIGGNIFSANGSGQTQDGAEFTDGGSYVGRATHEAGAASVVMDYTLNSSVGWATQAFEINALAGGGAFNAVPTIYRYAINKVGGLFR